MNRFTAFTERTGMQSKRPLLFGYHMGDCVHNEGMIGLCFVEWWKREGGNRRKSHSICVISVDVDDVFYISDNRYIHLHSPMFIHCWMEWIWFHRVVTLRHYCATIAPWRRSQDTENGKLRFFSKWYQLVEHRDEHKLQWQRWSGSHLLGACEHVIESDCTERRLCW